MGCVLTVDEKNSLKQKFNFKQFTTISLEVWEFLWEMKLSRNEMTLFSFLACIDPFGTRHEALPAIKDIAAYLDMGESSFYKAMCNLKEKGLCEFEMQGTFRNLVGYRFNNGINNDVQNETQNKEKTKVNKDETTEKNKKQENEIIPVSQTVIAEKTEENENIIDVKSEIVQSDIHKKARTEEEKDGQIIPQIKETAKIDPYFNNPRNPNRKRQLDDWIPDGPWRVETQSGFPTLDWKFVDYVSHKFFIDQFGDSEDQAMAKTKAYFRNDVNRLPEQWEAYQQHAFKATAAIHAGATATGQLKEADKEKLESISTAFKELPEYYQTTNKPTEIKPIEAQTKAYFPSDIPESKIMKPATNAQEYRQITGADNEATLEQKKAFFAAMAKLSQGNGGCIRSKNKLNQNHD